MCRRVAGRVSKFADSRAGLSSQDRDRRNGVFNGAVRYDPWWIESGMDFQVIGLVFKVWQGQSL